MHLKLLKKRFCLIANFYERWSLHNNSGHNITCTRFYNALSADFIRRCTAYPYFATSSRSWYEITASEGCSISGIEPSTSALRVRRVNHYTVACFVIIVQFEDTVDRFDWWSRAIHNAGARRRHYSESSSTFCEEFCVRTLSNGSVIINYEIMYVCLFACYIFHT